MNLHDMYDDIIGVDYKSLPLHSNNLLQTVISHLESYDILPSLQHVSDGE